MHHHLHLILATFGMLLLAACSDSGSDIIMPEPEPSSIPVSFSALTHWDTPQTRLAEDANSNAVSFTSGDAIGVFAYLNDHTSPDFMNNQKVVYNGNGWEYEPVKYWPQDGFLTFYGYYPQDSKGDFITVDETSDKVRIAYSNPYLDYDLMASDKVMKNCPSDEAVAFQMKHLMAKVTFTFTYASASEETGYEPVIHMVEFGGVPYSGVFAFEFDSKGIPQWESIDTDHTTTVKRFTNDVNGVIVTDGKKEISDFVTYLLPGSVVSGQFDVSINNRISSYTLPEADSFVVEQGKTYNLNFNIKKTESGHYFIASYSLWEEGGEIDGKLQ